jgi:hypothetical protein
MVCMSWVVWLTVELCLLWRRLIVNVIVVWGFYLILCSVCCIEWKQCHVHDADKMKMGCSDMWVPFEL